ncbi:hypothetical protein C0J52_23774 [Blattella germanica]|nr:hypothetical protein C0J52_23774 [Blattella germanica]
MWNKIPCPRSELELLFTLCGGQCFRWKKTGNDEWTGVFAKRIWIISQDEDNILYRVKTNLVSDNTDVCENIKLIESKKLTQETNGRKKKGKNKHLCEKVDSEENINGSEISSGMKLEDSLLRQYFRLDVSLEEKYAQWSKSDPHFKEASKKFTGIRILAQDPVENVFSFICSSNNHISRFIFILIFYTVPSFRHIMGICLVAGSRFAGRAEYS